MVLREHVIGRYRLQPGRQLLADGMPVPLGTKTLDLLTVLVESDGDLVTKDELLARVWPGVIVEEHTIQVHISLLRKVLGIDARWIVTVPRRGYRFAADVCVVPPVAEKLARDPLPPRPRNRLIGRTADVAAVLQALAGSGLVTIAGAGGVGKTRLALEVAHDLVAQYQDRVYFVDLSGLRDQALVPGAVASALDVPMVSEGSPLEPIKRRMRSQSLLIVLDNCEHVIQAVAEFAESLLLALPQVRLLATSRQALGCTEEQVYRLAPLALPNEGVNEARAALESAAVALLVDRVQSAEFQFALADTEASAAGVICRRLDGLPLAIEIASAWVSTFGLGGLAARLDAFFKLPSGTRRTVLLRHRSLEATLDWSHDLLTEAERRMFRRLAVFAGSFSLEGAEAVASSADLPILDVAPLLASLIQKSLVTAIPASGASCYRLLETTRAYAAERLNDAGEADRMHRLTHYLRDFFRAADVEYEGRGVDVWIPKCGPELDNLRAGLAWAFGPEGDADVGIEILSHAGPVYVALSLQAERVRWARHALSRVTAATPPQFRASLLLHSVPGNSFGDPMTAICAGEAVALLRQVGRPAKLAYALMVTATGLLRPGDVEEGEILLREAEALLRPLGLSAPLSGLLNLLSVARSLAGDPRGAAPYMREAIEMARSLEMRQWIEIASVNLAELEFQSGRQEVAIDLASATRDDARRHGNLRALGAAARNLGSYLIAVGRLDEAVHPLREGLRVNQSLALSYPIAICIEHLARLSAEREEAGHAAYLAGYTEAFYRNSGRQREVVEAQGWEALRRTLERMLSTSEVARWAALGAELSEDQAVALALAE